MSDRDDALLEEVEEKTRELAKLLDDFSDRLRRMRRRNRELEAEIAHFEEDLVRVRRWLEERA